MTTAPGVVVGAARLVTGGRWIRDRDRAFTHLDAGMVLTWEQLWWREALHRLHDELRAQALWPGPTVARLLRPDEFGRTVTLYVETVARAPSGPGPGWGLPEVMLRTPLPRCPVGGDELVVPADHLGR